MVLEKAHQEKRKRGYKKEDAGLKTRKMGKDRKNPSRGFKGGDGRGFYSLSDGNE